MNDRASPLSRRVPKTIRGATMKGASAAALALGLLLPPSAYAAAFAADKPADPPPAPQTTTPTPAPAPEADADKDIVVTGFRRSLSAALDVKRDSVSSVDAIVAEDIAKFPDQNLAESLQRIPGISIQRDAGEGRSITVRGLGSQFTRVRLNGLETVATSTDGASANRDRAFDFNVFASELFSSLVVHKTAEASLDEGSLGAVVDLNTGNPLRGKSGFTLVGSVQGSYNDLSKNFGPRVAGLLGWKSPDGTLGISVSAAYSRTDNLELGNNTVRWAQARFDSVNGTPCFYASNTSLVAVQNSGGFYRPSADCTKAALAFHARIPRYGEIAHRRERLGLTGSIQWEPTSSTKISLDGLYSRFSEDREEKWAEVLLRSNERSIDLLNPVYDGNNNLVSGTLNDAWVRTEHYLRQSKTTFYQFGGSWDQDVTDTFRFTVLGGFSRSNADIPVETTIVFDDRDAQGYKFDYSDSRYPVLTFGTSVTTPSNFQLAEIRDRPSNVTNKFRTAQIRTEWDVTDGFTIKAGGVYRRFQYDVLAYQRDTVVCGNGGVDLVLGTLACSPTSAFGPAAVYGFPVTAGLSENVTLGNAGQPTGNTNSWIIANLASAAAFTKLYQRPLLIDAGNNRSVTEEVKGGYLQFDAKGDIFGVRFALNAGVRYVRTNQSSTGLNSGVVATVERSYDDWLPAVNFALYPAKNVIIRAAVADVLTRPTLGSLTPGGSADGFNFRVTFGNPQLNPYRATSYDLSFEYYFKPGAIFSVALFKKDVKSFPVAASVTNATFDQTGLPVSVLLSSSPAFQNASLRSSPIWTLTTTVNGSGASLKGAEISLQLPFFFAPGFLKNFGILANATFVDSSATYSVQGPVITDCVPQANPATACPFGPLVTYNRTGTLFGLSKTSYNATIYYEDKKFSARASVSYRGPYVDANSGTGNVFEGYNRALNVDASVRYRVTSYLELSLEGTNLTDDYRDRFTDLDANRNYENNHFGRTFLFGGRIKL